MPRGRKRKVVMEISGDEDMIEDPVEAALANAEAGNDEEDEDEKVEFSKNDDEGEATDDANDDVKEDAPSTATLDISKAQDELTNLDLLICGKCHNVSYFVEQHLEHKKSECPGFSDLLRNNSKDSKAQVWAFVLYKSHKLKEKSDADWNVTSWQLYQKWSQLDENIKQTWVEAGRALQQVASSLPNTAKPIPKPKAKVVLTAAERQQQHQTLLELQKQLEDETETQMMSTLGLVRGKGKDGKEQKPGLNQIWRRSLTRKDHDDEDDEELYTVEKIVAKRVNQKTRQPEYLVKWLGFQSDQNTWEHVHNMSSCAKLIQEFEKNLARQKARKALEANKMNKNYIDTVQTTPGGRPVRSSALKALDQVKEWVGGKRSLDSDDDDDDDDKKDVEAILKKKFAPGGKSPLIMANSKGVMRVDPKQLPNLSSGVYILSQQSGLIKVAEPTAAKLTSCLGDNKKTIAESRTVMINETEVRKIPASQATPKVGILRKELATGIIKKENNISPGVNILQKVRPQKQIVRQAVRPRQIILGSSTAKRPLPGPVPSPLRPPPVRPKISIKPAGVARPRQQTTILRGVTTKKKIDDDDFESGLVDEFPKNDDSIAPQSPNAPMTLCPITGEPMNAGEGDKSPSHDEEMGDGDEDGMMRVAVSPGGSIHQVVQQRTQRPKQTRSLLNQRRTEIQAQETPQESELISIESEDGVIYHITPEQQQLLLQDGTLTMEPKQEESFPEHTEILFENGQLIGRRMVSSISETNASQDEQTMMLGVEGVKDENSEVEAEGYNEDGMLTLENAVQEAVSQANAEQNEAKADDSQMVAQIVQADPANPGGGPRKVVLLLPDGSLLETEMDEEQFQALDFEK